MTSSRRNTAKLVPQRTIKNAIHCSGVGLHSGAKVNLTLHPAGADTGIVFRRTDIGDGSWAVPARWTHAVETPLCTTLVGADGARVATVEHLMSALAGCGIDNAVVEINGPEVPIMDGSAAPFVFLIECAGTVAQEAPRRVLEVRKEIQVGDDSPTRLAALSPAPRPTIDFEIDFDSPAVGRQAWSVEVSEGSYKREIANARTFGFLHEVDEMRAMGLARGGSLENAVVIGPDGVINEGGLRHRNEFVRHKVLDFYGDLYLAGGTIVGHACGVRAGHALTLRLLRALFADESAWAWREMTAADVGAAPVLPERAVAAHV